MACCAAAAYVIYHILTIQSSLERFRKSCNFNKAKPQESRNSIGDVKICTFRVSGMTCAACTSHISTSLEKLEGVSRAEVSLPLGIARVGFTAAATSPSIIQTQLGNIGYDAEELPESGGLAMQSHEATIAQSRELSKIREAVFYSMCATSITVITDYLAPLNTSGSNPGLLKVFSVLSGTVATTACCHSLHVEAWRAVSNCHVDMSVLTSLALLLGLLDTCNSGLLAAGESSSFAALSLLSTVLLGGRFLKSSLTRQTFAATAFLASLLPSEAVLIDGSEHEFGRSTTVPTAMLRVGDRIVLKPGQSAPADGIVVRGSSKVIESCLSGDTRPRAKSRGDTVSAGCINTEATVEVEVTRVGRDTWLEKALEATWSAGVRKSSLHDWADTATAYFSSLVLLITFAAAFVEALGDKGSWKKALHRACIVLLSACPCALGLSVPSCIMLSNGVAARNQILMTGGSSAFTAAAHLKMVIFDKTGTLTGGTILVIDHFCATGRADHLEKTGILRLVLELERDNNHPVAQALVQFCQDHADKTASTESNTKSYRTESTQSHDGLGVEGCFRSLTTGQHLRVKIGSLRYMETSLRDTPEAIKQWLEDRPQLGKMTSGTVYVSMNQTIVACFQLSDKLRDRVIDTVKECRKRGLQVGLLTGDTRAAAHDIARAVGIPSSHVWAEVLPAGKAAVVEQLKSQHHGVAMIGDHINDVPALSAASIGIAIGNESFHLADSIVDALIMNDRRTVSPLERALFVFDLMKATRDRIVENISWAIAYNSIALLLSSGLGRVFGINFDMTPLHAGLGMSFSSVLILLNSMRLERRNTGVGQSY